MIQWFSELNCTKASLVSGTIVLPAHCLLLPFQCYNPTFLTAFCKLWTTPHFSSFLAMVHLFYSETLRAVQNLKRHSALLTATLQVFWIIVKKQAICGLILYHAMLIPSQLCHSCMVPQSSMCVLHVNKSLLNNFCENILNSIFSIKLLCIFVSIFQSDTSLSEWTSVNVFAQDKFPKTR